MSFRDLGIIELTVFAVLAAAFLLFFILFVILRRRKAANNRKFLKRQSVIDGRGSTEKSSICNRKRKPDRWGSQKLYAG